MSVVQATLLESTIMVSNAISPVTAQKQQANARTKEAITLSSKEIKNLLTPKVSRVLDKHLKLQSRTVVPLGVKLHQDTNYVKYQTSNGC